jgi:hypothetical protein
VLVSLSEFYLLCKKKLLAKRQTLGRDRHIAGLAIA